MVSFQEYLECASKEYLDGNGQRYGQTLMNKLHEVNSELYGVVMGVSLTDSHYIDPFYDDNLIPVFLIFASENW